MNVYVLKNEYYKSAADIPVTATEFSTGYDIKTISEPEIIGELSCDIEGVAYYKNIKYIQYHTGLYVNLEPDYANLDALIFPRSSIRKYNLQLANSIGLCDNDYIGEYLVCFNYIWQPEDLLVMNGSLVGRVNYENIYKKGDKVAQLKFTDVKHPTFILTDKLIETARGSGGFGSTDNKEKKNPLEERFKYVNSIVNKQNSNYNSSNINTLFGRYESTYNVGATEKYFDAFKDLTSSKKGTNE